MSLGQDLGYIAGFALTSLTVSLVFITFLLLYRYFKGEFRLKTSVKKILETYQQEIKTYPRQCMLLLIIGICAAYLYLPLTIQIFKMAKSFDVTSIPTEDRWSHAVAWINPLRLFIPYFAFNYPAKLKLIQRLLQDYPEGFGSGIPVGSGSPGLFLVIIGILGLYQARGKIFIYLPLITILVLCLFYHPDNLPLLKIFPWFSFNRITDRSSIIYPCIFVLFSLNFNPYIIRLPWRNLIIFLLVCLACTELYATYSFRTKYSFQHKQEKVSQTFFDYMDYLSNQPGEAVLDWPFCVEGANYWEVTKKLCPYYKINNSIYAMRAFHNKKVLGQYFGRLYPDQVQPYLEAGWDQMFVPQGDKFVTFGLDVAYEKAKQAGYEGSRRSLREDLKHGNIIYGIWSLPHRGYTEGKIKGVDQEGQSDYTEQKNINKRCFQDAHWSFFSDFYKYNDFAGINLYVDILPEECISEFYRRFGNPVMETVIPKTGKVQFIPKSPELRQQVNQELGLKLKFEDY